MNGIIYCRVSSKDQVKGTSLDSQEADCRALARTKHSAILKVFLERGESAKFADRTALMELMEYCRENKGRINYLFVWKLDRLARNVSDFYSLKALLLKYGVKVVSVTEPIDDNPEGKLLETILAGFAEFDNDIRAMRSVQGMRRRIQEGIFPFKPPLGYTCEQFKKHGLKKAEPDRPEEPLFTALQQIWKEFATGAYTKAEIRRLMTQRGIASRMGRPLPPQSIDNLFRNKYYAGILVDPWSGDEHEGRHIPLVSREVFARVQEVVCRKNRSKPHAEQRSELPLRGLARCPHCTKYLTGGFSRGRSRLYGYYTCGNKLCTERPNYPIDALHMEFREFLASLNMRSEFMTKLEEVIIEKALEWQATAEAKRAKSETELRALQTKMHQLIDMRAKDLLNDDEFRDQKALLGERKSALEAVNEKVIDMRRIRQELHAITAPLANLVETWDRLDPASRGRFKRMLLPVGFVVGQTRTAEKALLFSLPRRLGVRHSTEVAFTCDFLNQITQEIQAFATIFRDNEQDNSAA
ncbi:MAG TPA: recombinase family protein [Candidatus Angelobacter sp.]|nr:recombinase family protein [Candidatus Angelobacter sp.]